MSYRPIVVHSFRDSALRLTTCGKRVTASLSVSSTEPTTCAACQTFGPHRLRENRLALSPRLPVGLGGRP